MRRLKQPTRLGNFDQPTIMYDQWTLPDSELNCSVHLVYTRVIYSCSGENDFEHNATAPPGML